MGACAGLDDPALMSPGHKRKIFSQLNGMTTEEHGFSHSVFWSPFVLVGQGNQTLGDVASQQHHQTAPPPSQNLDPPGFESGSATTPTEPVASQGPEDAPPPPLPPRPPLLPFRPLTQRLGPHLQRRLSSSTAASSTTWMSQRCRRSGRL
jgi:hypothetical protein